MKGIDVKKTRFFKILVVMICERMRGSEKYVNYVSKARNLRIGARHQKDTFLCLVYNESDYINTCSLIRKNSILFLFKGKFQFSGCRFENLRMKQPPLFTSNVLRWMNSFIYVICSKRKFDMGINCAPFNTIGT